MSAPPKLTVFIFVLTAHLAILAFAFPHLDIQSNPQASAPASEASVGADQHNDDDEAEVENSHSDHLHSAEQAVPGYTEVAAAVVTDKPRRLIAVIPTAAVAAASANLGKSAIEARLAKLEVIESPAEPATPAAEPTPASKPVTLAKVEKSAPKPEPAVVRSQPAPETSSTKAGSGRMSHLRPLPKADR